MGKALGTSSSRGLALFLALMSCRGRAAICSPSFPYSERTTRDEPLLVPAPLRLAALGAPTRAQQLVFTRLMRSVPEPVLPTIPKKSMVDHSLLQLIPPSQIIPSSTRRPLSTSLYQQCSSLRTRLIHLQDFSVSFSVAAQPDSARRSTDPVTQLWDVFAIALPLLPQSASVPIVVEADIHSFDPTNERTKKHAIVLFAMNVKQVPGCEGSTVRDLWDRNSTDGFVRVVSNVINLVQQLPDDLFLQSAPSSPTIASALASTESLTSDNSLAAPSIEPGGARVNIIKELVDTERKYVQDLEVMQKYCDEAVSYLDRAPICSSPV
ncbi:hypothetical protein LXA43DRAFT_120387 [Ganoderma leucocontextum]|nr:hypothetical protein LXA43DRAFT_644261 [Ganoderma leucocontextum]KAI1794729.1 hypothetical protein LXA43DRAFT_120387 [Ganoderma leucocontextum]